LVGSPTNLAGIFLFWGTLTIFVLIIIIILPNSTFVTLNEKGMGIHFMYKERFIFYKDIELVDIYKTRKAKTVGVKYNQNYLSKVKHSTSLYKKTNSMLSDMHEFLPTTFLVYNPERINYIINSYLLKYRHLQNPSEILDEAPDLSSL
jgi:CRISPR/Cas system-associated protein Csx1